MEREKNPSICKSERFDSRHTCPGIRIIVREATSINECTATRARRPGRNRRKIVTPCGSQYWELIPWLSRVHPICATGVCCADFRVKRRGAALLFHVFLDNYKYYS